MPGTVNSRRSTALRALLAGTATVLAAGLAGGCAQFPSEQPRDWQQQGTLKPQGGPQPQLPGQDANQGGTAQPGRGSDTGTGQLPHRNGCQDSDPAVIATCLNPVYALAVLPGNTTLLAAERDTGRIMRVQKDQAPVQVASVPVDASGGGGLTGLALSPSYTEDQLIFAYITTPTDNRIIRLAPNDVPKPLVTGIPRGSSNNAGSLVVDDKGALLAATGDAGDAAASTNPGSLAGKLLRIDSFGKPPVDNPNPNSPIFAAGLHAPGGLCAAPGGGAAWVTDEAADKDRLYAVKPGTFTTAAWNWPDRPGATGCTSGPGWVSVTLSNSAQLFRLQVTKDGSGFSGKPKIDKLDNYGRVHAVTMGPDGVAWGGTVNKDGGKPVSSDDRVFRLRDQANGGGID